MMQHRLKLTYDISFTLTRRSGLRSNDLFTGPSSVTLNFNPIPMLAKEIKTGTVVVYEGNPVIIEGISVQSPSARGAATLYKFKARNVVTRNKVDITLKGTDSLNEADFSRRTVQFMYSDPTHMFLMDTEDYHQFELPLEDIADQLPYIKESTEVY